MQILVINLDRSADRRAFMREQLEALGLPYEFLRAYDGARGEHRAISRYDERQALRWLGHPLRDTEVACFASHHLAWSRCVERGEPTLILEDDVRLREDFADCLRLATDLVEQYGCIRLYAMFARRTRRIASLAGNRELVQYLKGPYGLQCYLLSPAGAGALLAHSQRWIDAVDTYVEQAWRHGVATLAIRPFGIEHAGTAGQLPSVISGVARAAPRPLFRQLRRSLTQLCYRLRRAWFNRRHVPPAPGNSRAD